MALTGNGAGVSIYTDGTESSADRRGADASISGNQLSGTFTITLRGWETEVSDSGAHEMLECEISSDESILVSVSTHRLRLSEYHVSAGFCT